MINEGNSGICPVGVFCSVTAWYVIDGFWVRLSMENFVGNPPITYNVSFTTATPASKRPGAIEAQSVQLFVFGS